MRGVDKEWKPFVENRVAEIRRLVAPECWNHCPGSSDPADLPSRGMAMEELQASALWQTGPEWLRADRPPEMNEQIMPDQCSAELRVLPLEEHGFSLHKGAFRDALVTAGPS